MFTDDMFTDEIEELLLETQRNCVPLAKDSVGFWERMVTIALLKAELQRRLVLRSLSKTFYLCIDRDQYDCFLQLSGCMFEQSIPLRGIAYYDKYTEMDNLAVVSACVTGPVYKKRLVAF